MAKRASTPRAGISGHGRLKRSLVLRDFLAADLHLRRRDAERYLSDQENAEGALDALNANGYLTALWGESLLDQVMQRTATGKLISDRGYISSKPFHVLWERGRHWVTKIRKNTRNKLMPLVE
jgi:hypothetical protein